MKRVVKKNELEMFFALAKKAIDKILEENPKAGVIIDKDKPSEVRMRYKDALNCIVKLETYFGLKGSLSLGICNSCTKWDKRAHQSVGDCMGTCRGGKSGKDTHAYDCCDQHSLEGGGYGL